MKVKFQKGATSIEIKRNDQQNAASDIEPIDNEAL
jgi:hypothetical protein